MISEVLMAEMRKQGIELRMSFPVAGLARTDAGIALDSSRGERLDGYDCVIWAVGRTPNTATSTWRPPGWRRVPTASCRWTSIRTPTCRASTPSATSPAGRR